MKKVYLDKFLKPCGIFNLIRLGNNNDGGYLVENKSLSEADIIISFGINDDWSFEKNFLEKRDISLISYDASINFKVFLRNFLYSLIRIDSPKNILKKFKTLLGYTIFFRGKKVHNQYMIGYRNNGSISVKEIFEKNIITKYKNIFLKIDIEGWEYRVLDEILEFADYICGLVIEFHDIDLHNDKIKKFIKNFPLNLAHCHANNYGGIDNKDMPLVIELTFTNALPINSEKKLFFPHELDMPNNKLVQEYKINF